MTDSPKVEKLRVGLISLGCAKNLVDAELMLGALLKDGIEITNEPARADAVIVVGTSAVVYPAAAIPLTAKRNGARIIEFNVEETELTRHITDVFIQGKAGTTLKEFIRHITHYLTLINSDAKKTN